MKKSIIAVLLAILMLLPLAMVAGKAITVEKDGREYLLRSPAPTVGDVNVLMIRLGFADYPVDDEDSPADSEATLLSYFDGAAGQDNVVGWADITAISAGRYQTVGLRKDATVVSTTITNNEYNIGQTNVNSWTDIAAVSAGMYNTIGLKKDGTVVSTPPISNNELDSGQTAVNGWGDMVAVSAGYYHTIALKKDGTVVSTLITNEENNIGQTDVNGWNLF